MPSCMMVDTALALLSLFESDWTSSLCLLAVKTRLLYKHRLCYKQHNPAAHTHFLKLHVNAHHIMSEIT